MPPPVQPPSASDEADNPTDIAREAFRLLAKRRIMPTPDAYRNAYEEIAGIARTSNAEAVLAEFASSFAAEQSKLGRNFSRLNGRFRQAVESRDWEAFGNGLRELLKECQAVVPQPAPAPSFPAPPSQASPDQQLALLRDLLHRLLSLAIPSLLRDAPDLAQESDTLGKAIKLAGTTAALNEALSRLKQLCFKIELKSDDMAQQYDLLLRLFRLLLENAGELVEDDAWVRGQLASVQELLSGPISQAALNDAARSLKEVIYKQGILKQSLAEARDAVKKMMMTFIDRMGSIATTTGDFHAKMDSYTLQISQAHDIPSLSHILDKVMHDAREIQTQALQSHEEMLGARRDMQSAVTRIRELEAQLEQLSELVHEDQLTGSLNRRGLDEVLEREVSRSERRRSPLCIALLDLDDFKRLNDTYGHTAGDEVLIYLVRVVKDTLRSMDVIARFGGEEFLIVLPDTDLRDAMQIITRLQRELTERIFMYNHERLFITFSAGIALRTPTEDALTLVERADTALYKAKKAGKNRIATDPE